MAAQPSIGGTALQQRLRAAADYLLADAPAVSSNPYEDASIVLGALAASVYESRDISDLWLLMTCISGSFPTVTELARAHREIPLREQGDCTLWLLQSGHSAGAVTRTLDRTIKVVADSVIADVQFTARNKLHTGIQRVVRNTLAVWEREQRSYQPVAWNGTLSCYQALSETERLRATDWRRAAHLPTDHHPVSNEPALVVPWRSVVLLAEVPPFHAKDRLAALAQSSANTVAAIGYDCIPIVSADLMPDGESERFVHYLSVIKHARRVAGISASSAAEFAGFAAMLPTQGLTGPVVTTVPLPVEITDLPDAIVTEVDSSDDVTSTETTPAASSRPMVLCVGSFEPRKNQLGLLYAAEVLWREGLDFELQLIGGSGWGGEFPERIRRLHQAKRPVTVRHRVTDNELSRAYHDARFTVFASLHEGYGLPVAESLAVRTPVITTAYGSTSEIGSEGGAVLVDPRDDDSLIDAMRDLLTNDARIAELVDEIDNRPIRTWQHYADELWRVLVAPGSSRSKPNRRRGSYWLPAASRQEEAV